jgi:hypothetical protein
MKKTLLLSGILLLLLCVATHAADIVLMRDAALNIDLLEARYTVKGGGVIDVAFLVNIAGKWTQVGNALTLSSTARHKESSVSLSLWKFTFAADGDYAKGKMTVSGSVSGGNTGKFSHTFNNLIDPNPDKETVLIDDILRYSYKTNTDYGCTVHFSYHNPAEPTAPWNTLTTLSLSIRDRRAAASQAMAGLQFSLTGNADYATGRLSISGSLTGSASGAFGPLTFYTFPDLSPAIQYTEGAYQYDETSKFWHMFCSEFPCGPWVIVPPSYAEAHATIPITVDGKTQQVIVQLWKGLCPRFADPPSMSLYKQSITGDPNSADAVQSMDQALALANAAAEVASVWSPVPFADVKTAADMVINHLAMINLGSHFPGGVGAEVGLYVPYTNPPLSTKWFWKPLPTSSVKIAFQLLNPRTGKPLIDAKEEAVWWKTKFMTSESYQQWAKANPNHPDNPLEYELHFTINGQKPMLNGKELVWKSTRLSGPIE